MSPLERHSVTPVAGWVALAGVVLALGAPAGWFLLARMGAPVSNAEVLYAYLVLGPMLVMAGAATLLGKLLDGARARTTELEAANQRLRELVTTDPLTGLRNRRYFQERLREECARSDRIDQPLGLIMLDLDHFKAINDAWGHPIGDAVLAHTSRLLAGSIRACDVACRVGGEEFAVLCPGAWDDEAQRLAERVRRALERSPLVVDKQEIKVTASLGVAVRIPDGGTEDLVRQADLALYRAKAAGRNRVEVAPVDPTPAPLPSPLPH